MPIRPKSIAGETRVRWDVSSSGVVPSGVYNKLLMRLEHNIFYLHARCDWLRCVSDVAHETQATQFRPFDRRHFTRHFFSAYRRKNRIFVNSQKNPDQQGVSYNGTAGAVAW